MTYASVQAALSQVQPQAFNSGTNLLSGEKSPKVLSYACDFSQAGATAGGYVIDLEPILQRGLIKGIQTVFIDNSQGNGFVSVNNPVYSQNIVLAPGYQGFFPAMAGSGSGNKFIVTSTGNALCNVDFINTIIAPMQWSGSVQPLAAGTSVIATPAQNIATDYSGTIATGGTAQVLMATNSARKGWSIQNIDYTDTGEGLWYSLTGTAAVGAPGSYCLAAGQTIAFPGGAAQGVTSNAISIIAATTGHKFTATSW